MPKISVITPVYNSEKYIRQCVDSLVSQTLNDIEILLIDDGSTDSSPQICDEYARNDSRVKVIHNKNSGMGVSYNIGMDMAQGEYIGFLESDDFAATDMFENLYDLAQKHNYPDIIKSSWFRYFTFEDKAYRNNSFDDIANNTVIEPKSFPELLSKQCTVWSAIYRTDFVRNKNVRYLETPGASYQDVGFTYKAFCNAESMVITPDAYVYYRQDNENSSVNSKEKADVIFKEYEEVDRFFNENPQIKKHFNTYKLMKQYYDYYWNYNRIAVHLKHDFIKQFGKDFKNYRDAGEFTPEFQRSVNMEFLEDIIKLAN